MSEHSRTHDVIERYNRRIEAGGGRPFVETFKFPAPVYTSRGASGRVYDFEFAMILDRNDGNAASHAIQEVYGTVMHRNLIPRLATRIGTKPVFLGIADFRRGGFVRVPYVQDYDFHKDYPE